MPPTATPALRLHEVTVVRDGRPIVDVMIDWLGEVIADRRPSTLKTMN